MVLQLCDGAVSEQCDQRLYRWYLPSQGHGHLWTGVEADFDGGQLSRTDGHRQPLGQRLSGFGSWRRHCGEEPDHQFGRCGQPAAHRKDRRGCAGAGRAHRCIAVADTSEPAVVALYEAGVVEGSLVNGQRLYSPEKSISRAEISKIVWQIDKMEIPEHVITYGSHTLQILPGVAVNAYDKDLFRREDGRIVYASDQVQTRVGIDVSQFQREIDWEAVKNDVWTTL